MPIKAAAQSAVKIATWVWRGAVFVLLFFFCLQNADRVSLKFFDFESRMPLSLLMLIFFVLGVSIGMVALVPRLVRRRREVAQAQKEASALKVEVEGLRSRLAGAPLDAAPASVNLAALAPPL
jgi:lipopolysaccharide assembly protein A